MRLSEAAARGVLAGAAATMALDLVTYGDMLVRGRSPSSIPGELVKALASRAGLTELTGEDEASANRRSAVGALLGFANGLGSGLVFGIVRPALRDSVPQVVAGLALGAASMAASDVPMVQLGLTNPKEWGVAGWLSDLIPHAVFGLTLAYVFDALSDLL